MRPVDIVALVSSIVIATLMAIIKARKSVFAIRTIPAVFMFFGPVTIIVHMFFHIAYVGYGTIQSINNNSFTYTFKLYSLFLMAGILIYFSVKLMKRLNQFLVVGRYFEVIKTMIAIGVISAPVILLNPLGSLPVMVCIITLIAMRFVRRVNAVTEKLHKETKELLSSY
jgi:hypothetical protein